MCGKKNEEAALKFDENGAVILPACANSKGCSGKCKAAKQLEEVNEQTRAITLRPTLIINGVEQPFTLNFVQ